MTPELDQRRRERRCPFDGPMLISPAMRPAALAHTLQSVAAWLSAACPGAITVLDDWHEHDGFLCKARPSSWTEVSRWFAHGSALYAARATDYDVRRGILASDYRFYLRFYVDCDEPFDAAEGEWDLAADTALLDRLQLALPALGQLPRVDAGRSYDLRYGG